jgi:hypothetical protein
MSKRQPINTAAGAIKAMQDALAGQIQPPPHVKLRECDIPFWCSIMDSRPRDAWDNADLEMAANLAKAKADIARLHEEIEAEGDIIENLKGTPIVNPRHALLETLTRRSVALTRMLHCHPEAKEGPSEKQTARHKAGKEAAVKAAAVKQDDDAGLIPGVH